MRKDVFVQKLSDEYYESLYWYAKEMCPDDELMFQIIREAFEVAYLKADELRKCSDVREWLYKAVRYQLMKHADEMQIPELEKEKMPLAQYEEEYDRERVIEKGKSKRLPGRRKSSKKKSNGESVKNKVLGLISKFKNS